MIRTGAYGRFRVRPLRRSYRAAAVVIAALGAANDGFIGARCMAAMRRLAQTTRVRRRRKRLHGCRNNRAGKRKQQQQSGNQSLHVVDLEPQKGGFRIEHA